MGFGFDMAKAKDIHRENIRYAREEPLKGLDVDFQKALEKGDSTTDIVSKKQALRDAPNLKEIEDATDVDTLKKQWDASILGKTPYTE